MAAQEQLLLFIVDGGVYTPVGAALDTLSAWIKTKALDFGNSSFTKMLDQIHLGLSNRRNQLNMAVEIYGSDDEEGPFTLLQTLPVAADDPLHPDVMACRYFVFIFRDSAVRERWQLSTFDIDGEILGDEF